MNLGASASRVLMWINRAARADRKASIPGILIHVNAVDWGARIDEFCRPGDGRAFKSEVQPWFAGSFRMWSKGNAS